jgi:hypothetical protein
MRSDASIQSSAGDGAGWTRGSSQPLPNDLARPATTDASRLLAALREMEQRATTERKISLSPLSPQPRPPI